MTPKIAAALDRVDVGVTAQRVAGGELAEERNDADRCADRDEVEGNGKRSEQRCAQDRDQHQEGDRNNCADHQREPRLGGSGVVVERGGAAADAGAHATGPTQRGGVGEQPRADLAGAGGVEAGGGDDQEVRAAWPPWETSIASPARKGRGWGAVDRRQCQVTRTKEARRNTAQLRGLALQRSRGGGRAPQASLERVGAPVAAWRGRGEGAGTAFERAKARLEAAGSRAEVAKAGPQVPRAPGEAPGAALQAAVRLRRAGFEATFEGAAVSAQARCCSSLVDSSGRATIVACSACERREGSLRAEASSLARQPPGTSEPIGAEAGQ